MCRTASATCHPCIVERRFSPGHINFLKGRVQRRGDRPRQWLYATKPLFARLKKPLADALNGIDEVRLIVELGRFSPGHIRLEMNADRYLITATHDNMHFAEEIPLPKNVDTSRKEEHFKDGILELVLPRKSKRAPALQEERES